MAFQRGDVVLVPFPFTDLSAAKTRPAVVVSGDLYHQVRPDLLLAYVSSQVAQAHPSLDYLLVDWALAGLPKPSFVRPKIATIEPALIAHHAGRLTDRDLHEVDRRLRQALSLIPTILVDIVRDVDLFSQPAAMVQALAEKSLAAVAALAALGSTEVDLRRLGNLLPSAIPPE